MTARQVPQAALNRIHLVRSQIGFVLQSANNVTQSQKMRPCAAPVTKSRSPVHQSRVAHLEEKPHKMYQIDPDSIIQMSLFISLQGITKKHAPTQKMRPCAAIPKLTPQSDKLTSHSPSGSPEPRHALTVVKW